MTRLPIVTDAHHLKAVAGSSYVVLRPHDDVAGAFRHIQTQVKVELGDQEATFPAAHLTLKGFGSAAPDVAIAATKDWADGTPPLPITIQDATVFSDARVAVLRVERTPPLASALERLREVGEGLPPSDADAIAPDDWIFHLTLVYGDRLSGRRWAAFETWVERLEIQPASSIATEAELVSFDGGPERLVATFPLTG